jgi:OOP family OmpA-OmpF porin
MMKKLGFSALLAASLLSAGDYNYELTPVAGYVYTEGNTGIKNHPVYGAQMQFNNLGTLLKPELSVLYSDADFENNMGDADIFRTAISGVYEYAASNNITPFAKAGLGYEYLNERTYDNRNSTFADAGAGVKIGLMDQLALKLEALYMLKFNDYRWDNSLALLAGLNFAFGEKEQPAAPAPVPEPKPEPKPEPVVAAPVDSDRDGVFDPQDQCPNSPAGYPVDGRGCNIDSDKDGVLDPADKCPNTPEGFKVNEEGCPVKATLHLNFATDSNAVDAEGAAKVNTFAGYLKGSPACKVTIVGHTDSVGSEAYNQKLSVKRAEKVKTMLIEDGIDASRLFTDGEGEAMPIATNETPEGRAENRRIEVELCK